MKEKKVNILLFFMILSLLLSILCYFCITKPNEDKNRELYNSDWLKYQLENLHMNKFNYLNGLWLMFSGMFFIFLLILLDIPSFEEVYKKVKKDFKEKFNV